MSSEPAPIARDPDIPEHYRHWSGDPCEDHNGPFFFHMDGEIARTMMRVRPDNCNAHGTVHGGTLMMMADYTVCIAAIGGSKEPVVTVSCSNEFIGSAGEGDLVEGRGEIMRRGGSLVFVRAELRAGDRLLLTASSVLKRLRR